MSPKDYWRDNSWFKSLLQVGVDEKLIASKTEAEEEIIEVMNGCICCTVRSDLVSALKRMHTKVKNFDAVLIETTGMADPAPVAQTFFVDDDVQAKYRLDGIITIVDAAHIEQHLDEEKPEGVENESVEQLAFADRVILNKCDLVGKDAKTEVAKEECQDVEIDKPEDAVDSKEKEERLQKLEARIRAINPGAPIIRSTFSQVDPQKLLMLNAFDLDKVLTMDPEFLNQSPDDHIHDDSISSVAWSFPGLEVNVNALEILCSSLIQEMGNDLYRYKGVLAVKGCREKFVFQGVHMMFSGGLSDSQTWSEGEAKECRFVFIGKHMKEKGDTLKQDFMACAAEDPLRFKVGDMVEAKGPSGWTPAKVLKTWDAGNPYRLELQDKRKTNVWGPFDDARFVKRKTNGSNGY